MTVLADEIDVTGGPLARASAELQRELRQRHARSGERGAEPVVLPLGAADTLGHGHQDPYASRRPRADVQLTARAVLLGPWIPAGAPTACGQCLAMRWQRLRSRSEREALELGAEPRGAEEWPLLTPYAVDAVWAAHQAVRAGETRSVPGRGERQDGWTEADRELPWVARVDLRTLALVTVPLLPEPLCPHCVRPQPEASDSVPGTPRSRPKPHPDGYRLRSLDAFPLPTAALANPVCGALGSGTYLNPASTTTAPVSGTNFVRGYAGLNDVTWSGQANSYRTSRTLAYMEGLERYAGTHRRRGTTPVLASYLDVADHALNPADCGFYDPRTYVEDPMLSVFDEAREIPWVWGQSLRDDRPLLVPARLAHYSAGVPADNFVFECSNGCATGGSLEEAALFGLLELIERDAFLLAWYGRARLTEIDLDSCRSGAVRSMIDRAALHGYDVHAFDNRMDLAIPVVTALAVRRDGGVGTLSFSAAAGFDPEETVEAALSEVLTYIPHLPYQAAERRDELEAMADDFTKVLHLKDHAQLYGLPRMTPYAEEYLRPADVRPLDQVFDGWREQRPRTGDLLDDLLLVRTELAAAGYDVIVVDQTTAEQRRMGLYTVSTLVPGLLPLDFGWTRQRALRMPRLRTALRAAGRRTDELPQAEVKVAPHPFP